jgi:hypothetical protein
MAPNPYSQFKNRVIKTVYFPNGNHWEGSKCTITFEDGFVYSTISDTAYGIASYLKMSQSDMKKVGL